MGADKTLVYALAGAMALVLLLIVILLIARSKQKKRRIEETRLQVEEETRLQTEEEARLQAEEEARLQAEKQAREIAEAQARAQAEEEARRKAEEEARRKAEEQAREIAEAQARAQAEADAEARRQAEAQRQAEAELAQIRADAKARAEAEARMPAEEPPPLPEARSPTTPAARAPSSRQPRAMGTSPSTSSGGVATVLVVEDSATMQRVFEICLNDEGCAITAVTRGMDALPRAREIAPSLIIVDLSLDDLDSYQLCADLHQEAALATTPILLCHGPNATHYPARDRGVGVTDAIEKPFATQELVDKVNTLLGRATAAPSENLSVHPSRRGRPSQFGQETAPAPVAPAAAPAPTPAPTPSPAPRAPAPTPTRAPAPMPAPAARTPAPAPTPRPSGTQLKVLVIDDSTTMGRVFEISLADDCEVTVVTTGAEALPMAQHLSPDLVVADLSLADLDGYAICAELRKDDALAQVPVLLCHGSNTTYDAARAQQVGATDVIEKPFATQDLVDKVHELTAA